MLVNTRRVATHSGGVNWDIVPHTHTHTRERAADLCAVERNTASVIMRDKGSRGYLLRYESGEDGPEIATHIEVKANILASLLSSSGTKRWTTCRRNSVTVT